MDHQRYIRLRIPGPEEFEAGECYQNVSVPEGVVRAGIDLLQAFVAQYYNDLGSEPEHDVWDALALSAASMQSALMAAWEADY